MPILSDVTQGTISVAANGTAVTGVGTSFQTAGFQEGDLFFANGYQGIVGSVTSNTALTLDQPWRGGALSGSSYRLRYQGDASRLTAMARQLITLLGTGGNIEALAGLGGAANRFPVFTGAGTMEVKTIAPLAVSLLDDPDAATFYATLGQIPNAQVRNDLAADKAFRRGNILASVAQAAGVPTGGLIERGSNANGEYVRFADGTQICWGSSTPNAATAANNLYGAASGAAVTGNDTVSLPASFANNAYRFSINVTFRGFAVLAGYSKTTGAVTSRLGVSGASAADVPYDWIAVGRWF